MKGKGKKYDSYAPELCGLGSFLSSKNNSE